MVVPRVIIHFRLGFSIFNKPSSFLGIPHDFGNLHIYLRPQAAAEENGDHLWDSNLHMLGGPRAQWLKKITPVEKVGTAPRELWRKSAVRT